jgi:ArsR family transcriptional regulator
MNKQSPYELMHAPCCTLDITGDEQGRLVEMFNGLGNPVRFEILKYLVTHNNCITGDIVDALPLAQATVSQHLKVLEDAGWIERTSTGAATKICQHEGNIAWFRSKVEIIF